MNFADRSTAFGLNSPAPSVRRKSPGSRTQGRWRWFEQLRQLKEIVSGMALMSAHMAGKRAGHAPMQIPFSASLGVMPAIASVNTPRLLTITAHFPLGCGPTAATASCTMDAGARFLDVRLNTASPDFAFFDLVLVPYTVELIFVPSEEGDLPVRVMTTDGMVVTESIVKTRDARGDARQFEVTGKWIDATSKESGLALAPDGPAHKTVVGTWNFHDHQGVYRRYSIQSVHWKEQDVEAEGAIFETTPHSVTAPSPDLASPPPGSANQLGLARITFHGLDSAHIFALGFGGNVLFMSNLVRATF